MLTWIFMGLLALIVLFFAIAKFHLGGPDCSQYDRKDIPLFHDGGKDQSSGREELKAFLAKHYTPPKGVSLKERVAHLRNGYEYQGRTRSFESQFQDDTASARGLDVPGEWTLPDGVDATKRILFLHGGAFIVGSPVSHRPITDNLARLTGCAVFAPHYRLGPESGRKDGIADCRAAYKWILENGPDGPQVAEKVGVAGDSAGGNLTLVTAQWARDTGLRAPDAIVAMSPTTDNTGSGPSMTANADTDAVLGAALRPISKLPKSIRVWIMWFTGKINPASPDASPLFAKCHDLPPTLIQVSNSEVLFSDGCRFAQKAQQAGSPVQLQVWRGQEHVWQHYDEMIPEAKPAFEEIAKFFESHGVSAKG